MFGPAREATALRYAESVLPVLVHCEDHLEERLDLTGLAAAAGFSPFHFHRVFQHVVGEAPKEHLRRLRLERSVYRLKGSPDNVLQIALESGFATHETFTRAFASRFGITPSEFRGLLRSYRASVDDELGSRTYAGFADDTPLTLRFDVRKEPLTVRQTPARHLVFVRHIGFEGLLAGGRTYTSLWNGVLAYADAHGIDYTPDLLVGITHDDPYVTDESRIRFDACLEVPGPIDVVHPVGYRVLPSQLCVGRRHAGGLEEIAKTFAYIGIAWLPGDDYGLRPAAPFEVHSCARASASDGRLERLFTDAYVPLERIRPVRKEKR